MLLAFVAARARSACYLQRSLDPLQHGWYPVCHSPACCYSQACYQNTRLFLPKCSIRHLSLQNCKVPISLFLQSASVPLVGSSSLKDTNYSLHAKMIQFHASAKHYKHALNQLSIIDKVLRRKSTG